MKPFLFPSIIAAVMAFAAYRVTQKDLDSGIFMLTDSSIELLGQSSISWTEISQAASAGAGADSAQDPAVASIEDAAPNEVIPSEFADLAKRRPVEYAAVVKAFRQAHEDSRTVAMKDVIWRHYRIVR